MSNKQPQLLKKRMRVMVDIEVTVSEVDSEPDGIVINEIDWPEAQKVLLHALMRDKPSFLAYLKSEAFDKLVDMGHWEWDREPVNLGQFKSITAFLPSAAETLPDEVAQCFKHPETDIWDWECIDRLRNAIESKIVAVEVEEVASDDQKKGVNSSN